jgi:hypothetical protein
MFFFFEPPRPSGVCTRVSPVVSRSFVRMQPSLGTRVESREEIGFPIQTWCVDALRGFRLCQIGRIHLSAEPLGLRLQIDACALVIGSRNAGTRPTLRY